MQLIEIMPSDGWASFEKDLHDRFNINCTIFDSKGKGLSGAKLFANSLCPAIKGNPDSLSAICMASNQNLSARARNSQSSVIDQCDAGMVKIAVPIFLDGDFLGTVSVCGVLPDDGEVESFLINKTANLDEEQIEALAQDVGRLTHQEAVQIKDFIEERLEVLCRVCKKAG
ncbi:MAG: PocR ligand-binding domain-containing protein [Desulfatibacillaceae bacterium]|nr:PocR ligand-binding domain-containing protein [Desulfatibacillaceae bacterium]